MTDLQSGIKVGRTAVTGTLKYVTGYTGFSGNEELQSGHYLALHFAAEDADRITVQLINGDYPPVELDEDGINIFRIKNKDSQAINVVAYSENGVTSRIYDLTGLTLEPKGE